MGPRGLPGTVESAMGPPGNLVIVDLVALSDVHFRTAGTSGFDGSGWFNWATWTARAAW